jgi:hypothetical protein
MAGFGVQGKMGGYDGLRRPGEGQTLVNLLTEEWAVKGALETSGVLMSFIIPIFVLMRVAGRNSPLTQVQRMSRTTFSVEWDHLCPSG